MEFPGAGVVPLEAPPESLRDFVRRKFRTFLRTVNYNVNGVISKKHVLEEVESYVNATFPEEERQKAIAERLDVWDYVLFCDLPVDVITEDECVNQWEKRVYSPPEERKRLMERDKKICTVFFDQIDLNKDNLIQYSEFYKAAKLLQEDTIKAMFNAYDVNKDGVISLEEFRFGLIFFRYASGPDDALSQMFGPILDQE